MSDTKYRVKNMCRYDIGVKFANGMEANIIPGSFQLMTADDIAYIESICSEDKYFSSKMLVPVDSEGKPLDLNNLNLYLTEDAPQHLTDEDIRSILKQSAKKLATTLEGIDDPAELSAINDIAKEMDLPASKIKVLTAKMPNSDILDPDDPD